MPQIIEGNLNAEGRKVAIVASRFNEFITGRLIEGALDALTRHGVKDTDIAVCRVPGAFEIPQAARRLALSGNYDGVICLGAVIRGSTPHFDYVAAEVSKGLAQVSLKSGLPVGFGVLTTNDIEQAIERAGSKAGNKGAEAALSVMESARVLQQI